MTKENVEHPEVRDFEVEQMFDNHPLERHKFSFTVDGNEFKGHFFGDGITWMHPNPKQIIGDEKVNAIENKVYELLEQHGISSLD